MRVTRFDNVIRTVCITSAILVLSGCGRVIGSETSPNGEMTVEVREYGPFVDKVVAIDLSERGETVQVYNDGKGRGPAIVQIVWSHDSQRFGVMVFDVSNSDILFAYDVTRDSEVDPVLVIDELHMALIERFGLQEEAETDPDFDPVEWIWDRIIHFEVRTLRSDCREGRPCAN